MRRLGSLGSLLWFSAFIATRLIAFYYYPRCAEDAFITFRTARNLLWYGAPTFNPGEPSWPASSPLWLIYCFFGIALKVPIEVWAHLGSLVAECFLLVGIYRLTNRRTAIAFGIMLAAYQCAIAISLSGIEMFAMVAAFVWALKGNRLALATLAFSRPEGVLLAAIAGWPWRKNLLPLGIGASVWLMMMLGTGCLMPAGVSAKVGTYGLHLFKGVRWLSLFWPWGSGGLEQQSMGVLGAAAVLLGWAWRIRGKALVFVLCGLGLIAAYFAAGSVYFFWYMALPICACMLCIALIPTRLVYVAALAVSLISWTTDYPVRRWVFQYRLLMRVAMSLPEQGTVIMDAIGVAGWQRPYIRFVDVIGLCSPKSESVRKDNKDGWLTYLIQEEKPDVVVIKFHELATNQADAGSGKPFSAETGVVGAIYSGKNEQVKDWATVLGYRPHQIDQDVILKLMEPKP